MRNDGRETTMNLIASPEVVTALALALGVLPSALLDLADRASQFVR